MASPDAQTWLHRMGVTALAPPRALDAFACLLGSSLTQTTVAEVDWRRFKELFEVRARRPLLENIHASPPQPARPPEIKPPPIIEELKHKNPAARRSLLIDYLQGEVATVLGFEPSYRPNPEQGFFDLGMDSLLAVELKNRIVEGLGLSLLPTLAFDHPNIHSLADFLLRELGWETGEIQAQPLRAMHQAAAASSQIAQLPEDEIEASIADRLERLEALVRKD
jgi:hypothetical protein